MSTGKRILDIIQWASNNISQKPLYVQHFCEFFMKETCNKYTWRVPYNTKSKKSTGLNKTKSAFHAFN